MLLNNIKSIACLKFTTKQISTTKVTQDKHLKIINDYKKSIEKEQKKEVKSTEAKVLSIFINNGKVSFQDNKISSLSTKEKSAVKQSLVEFLKQIDI